MKAIFGIMIDALRLMYKTAYNILFSGWRHMGGGHYHYFEEKE